MMIVLPGDPIPIESPQGQESPLKVGPGILQQEALLLATKAGPLVSSSAITFVDSKQKKYIPSTGESVVGIVLSRHAESYRVDIGGPQPGNLPLLAFEGATKRNRPNLTPGTLVYCRISQAHSDMEPELECVNPSNGKSDGYGELKDGFMVQVNLKLSRDLLQSQHPLLTHLSKLFPFELAIGINGRIWINSETPDKIILIANVLQTADGGLPASKIPSMIKALKQKLYTDS